MARPRDGPVEGHWMPGWAGTSSSKVLLPDIMSSYSRNSSLSLRLRCIMTDAFLTMPRSCSPSSLLSSMPILAIAATTVFLTECFPMTRVLSMPTSDGS